MRPILQLEHVSKRFSTPGSGGCAAVDGVSLSIHPGECVGLVGQSGCGKSTLARLACRLLDVSSGVIYLDGQDITRSRGRQLRAVYRKIQMVFQSPGASFDPRKTLGYSVGESLRNQGCSKQEVEIQVEQLLEQCGLERRYAGRYPHQVSGGECQRAAIARALAAEPSLILLDEATSALDVITQQQIMQLLEEWKGKRHLAYLLISHDLALVERFCQRILVMDGGKLVEQGAPEQSIGSPSSPAARRLVEAASL